jgi:hypothetical protein
VTQEEYPNFHFLTTGKMNKEGLSTPGTSQFYGKATIFEQDSEINSWTGGNLSSNGHDIAKFFYNLLGSDQKLLSSASMDYMLKTRLLDKGWAKGLLDYGAGLMVLNVDL